MPAPKRPGSTDALATYRAKRSADRTPEPSGAAVASAPTPGGLFVVHQHAATRLHFDLRLEMDGVLKSWAVPKGPSKNPADKRLAVHVEDHPLEYGDFEGIIPEGNYGAGAVIVWDRGAWVPLEEPHEGLARGKLLFDLRGYKLKGRWTLVKLKKGHKEWLLIKERDAQVSTDGDAFPAGSVLSGRTVEELKDGKDPAAAIRAELKRLKVAVREVKAADVAPMLAETRERPFSRDGWIFELKLDGYRIVAGREAGEARLWSRNGNDLTDTFPEVTRAVAALPYDRLVLDGEVVVHDERGLPSFSLLQQRGRLTRESEVRRAAVRLPAMMYCFDLLAVEGHDLRELPLLTRKRVLAGLLPAAGPLKYLDHVETAGEEFYAQVERMGLEGVVAKKADSPYRSRRSADWVKVRADLADDFVVVGLSRPRGSRAGFGALHLAQYRGGKLWYAGRAGSGFTDKELKAVSAVLDEIITGEPPCEGPLPAGRNNLWVEPRLVAEVRFKERTPDGLLRQPVFLRFRDDKRPEECVVKGSGEEGGVSSDARLGAGAPPRGSQGTAPPSPAFQFSNIEKVFWPDEGYTKGDLIAFYKAVAPWILPYLEDRPVVMTRYPDGINGKSFFQKDAPEWSHEFVRTVTIWSEESQRELNYFVIEDEAALLYVANMASIPLHIWGSRVSSLELPDWCILDLDPKEAPFTDVVKVARVLHDLCGEIELPSFIKTSGSTGLHVLVPVGRQTTYQQCRTLGGLLARLVAAEIPEAATITRQVGKREGKVYLDYVQNGHGRLLVSPFCARPVPGALVSTPLEWREVTPKLDISAFTIRTVPARMRKRKQDPLRPVLDLKPDLPSALAKLHQRVSRRGRKH